MQTRRDHIQAYQFSTGRLVHAVATGDTGIGEQPFRRGNLGTVIGVAIAVLLSVGAVIYGLISPAPDNSWRSQGSIIVEKETGTRYVLLDGELRPTANYASALLAAGSQPKIHMIPRGTLAGIPVGPQIGIAGAPDSLPSPSALLSGTWALCLSPAGTGDTVLDLAPGGRTSSAPQRPILVIAASAAASGAPAGSVAGGASGEYVLWGAKKYPVPNASVLAALGLGNQAPVQAAAYWLDLLPTGDGLSPARIASEGSPGAPIAGHPARIGQVFQTTAAGVNQFYVLEGDGLAPITPTEAALFATRSGHPLPTVTMSPSDIAAAPTSRDQSLLRRLPDVLSAAPFAPDSTQLCVKVASGPNAATALVTEDDRLFPAGARVLVPRGAGLIAMSTSVSQLTNNPYIFLITDTGKRFEIGSSNTLQALGYSGAAGHTMPDAILALVPPGPALSADAARKAVS